MLISIALSIITMILIQLPTKKIDIKQSKINIVRVLALFIIPVVVVTVSWSVYTNQNEDVFAGKESCIWQCNTRC